jgi:hypothetical protein
MFQPDVNLRVRVLTDALARTVRRCEELEELVIALKREREPSEVSISGWAMK